ncbi:MAG: IclR family transcriptional regulator, regulon repressor [Thermosediminibacterales bacterium]|nr:IclR family transcriptional regulator, regulon repressor [Thermosediminibacterales bacterium]MDK2835721.1 IclR family transcriptional regulator, regulon repressor [Thermosediminibacterales bacterium]
MEKNLSTQKHIINSISRAVDILELFDQYNLELGVTEIANKLNLHKSSVHRIVSTLEHKGILEKNSTNSKYRLGIKLYIIGILARNENELIAVSIPHLKRLTEISGETTNLVVLNGCKCLYIAQQTSDKMVRIFTKIGAKILPHCTAVGKVLLSEMEENEIEHIISVNGLPSYTKNTITKKEKLLEELRKARAEGYAMDDEEREEGVMCIAAPIRDRNKTIIAAISISGPKYRFDNSDIDKYILAVKEEAAAISKELGFKP